MGGALSQHVNRRTILGSIATGSLASTSGCAALKPPDLEDLKISPDGLESPDLTATHLTLPIILEIHNDGDSRIPKTTVNFDTYINGGHVAIGNTNTPAINPHDIIKTTVTLIIDYGDVGEQVLNALKRFSFTLTLEGEAEATGPLGFFSSTQPFEVEHHVS